MEPRVEILRSPGNGEGHRLKRKKRRGGEAEFLLPRRGGKDGEETRRVASGGLRFIAYLHIFTESPRRFIKFNVFTRVGAIPFPGRFVDTLYL